MNSPVLARKYRPRDFSEMVGQEQVVQALVNALTSKRLHHAYLFTGTRGVGKTTVSRILAKSLNCTGPDGRGDITATPCGVCTSCTEIAADRFIDYVEMDAASNRKIDEVRDLLERAAYVPAVGRFKVFMIDEVHQLTNESFNALLKTLEEPPDYLKFVLATTDPQRLPVTVLSRCLQFNLRPMAPETVRTHLRKVLAAEAIEAEPGALKLLARAAQGSMRDALSLADQAIAFGAGRLMETEVRRMLGAVGRAPIFAVLDALAAADGAAIVAAVEALRMEGLSADGTLEELAVVLQELAVLAHLPEALDADDPDSAALANRQALLPADELQLFYSMALHGRAELGLAPDEYSGLAMVLLRMLAFRPASGSAAIAKPRPAPTAALVRPTKVASSVVATPTPVATVADGSAASRTTATPPPWDDDVPFDQDAQAADVAPAPRSPAGDRWAELVAALIDTDAIAAMPRALAMQAQCVGLDAEETRVVLRVEGESLRSAAHAQKLQAALAQHLGHAVHVELEAGPVQDSVARREVAERERRQAEAEQLIHNDPLVIQLTARYRGARIVPGSIKPI